MKKFMTLKNIYNLLKENVDSYDVKEWYVQAAWCGNEFERVCEAFYNFDETGFLWVVAEYICEEYTAEEFADVVFEENWEDVISLLPPYLKFTTEAERTDFVDYVHCTIKWKENGKFEDVIIAVDKNFEDMENEPYDDEDILFYCEDIEDVGRLFDEDNGEEFYIFEYGSVE